MKIKFKSISGDDVTQFETEAKCENGTYIFKDESLEDTKMGIMIIDEKNIFISRIGKVNMNFELIEGVQTEGTFESIDGLEFDFSVNCTKIEIENDIIAFEYDYYFDDVMQSSHKISIIIDENA